MNYTHYRNTRFESLLFQNMIYPWKSRMLLELFRTIHFPLKRNPFPNSSPIPQYQTVQKCGMCNHNNYTSWKNTKIVMNTNFIFSSSLFEKKTFRWKERTGSSLSMRDSDPVLYWETNVRHLWQISYGLWWGFSCSSEIRVQKCKIKYILENYNAHTIPRGWRWEKEKNKNKEGEAMEKEGLEGET